MKFRFLSRIRSFFQSLFGGKSKASQKCSYAADSFISHFSDSQIARLTEQDHSVLSTAIDQVPNIISNRVGTVSPTIVETVLSSTTDVGLNAQEQLLKKQYLDNIANGRAVDGRLFKLSNVQTREVHFLRRMDGDAQDLFKKTDKIQRLLGPYAVKLHHHRYFDQTYVGEMQYIEGLRNVEDELVLMTDPEKRAERLLVLTRKMLALVEYLQKKGLYWPDIKPKNFYIRPDTDELCVADNKNLFTRKNKFLPRYAFTEEYTAPIIFTHDPIRDKQRKNKVEFSEYHEQLYFSFLKSIETLLALCDKEQPAAKNVAVYVQGMRRYSSIFAAKSLLYPDKKSVKESLPISPAVHHRPLFKKRNSNENLHAGLELMKVGLFGHVSVTEQALMSESQPVVSKKSFLSRLFRLG